MIGSSSIADSVPAWISRGAESGEISAKKRDAETDSEGFLRLPPIARNPQQAVKDFMQAKKEGKEQAKRNNRSNTKVSLLDREDYDDDDHNNFNDRSNGRKPRRRDPEVIENTQGLVAYVRFNENDPDLAEYSRAAAEVKQRHSQQQQQHHQDQAKQQTLQRKYSNLNVWINPSEGRKVRTELQAKSKTSRGNSSSNAGPRGDESRNVNAEIHNLHNHSAPLNLPPVAGKNDSNDISPYFAGRKKSKNNSNDQAKKTESKQQQEPSSIDVSPVQKNLTSGNEVENNAKLSSKRTNSSSPPSSPNSKNNDDLLLMNSGSLENTLNNLNNTNSGEKNQSGDLGEASITSLPGLLSGDDSGTLHVAGANKRKVGRNNAVVLISSPSPTTSPRQKNFVPAAAKAKNTSSKKNSNHNTSKKTAPDNHNNNNNHYSENENQKNLSNNHDDDDLDQDLMTMKPSDLTFTYIKLLEKNESYARRNIDKAFFEQLTKFAPQRERLSNFVRMLARDRLSIESEETKARNSTIYPDYDWETKQIASVMQHDAGIAQFHEQQRPSCPVLLRPNGRINIDTNHSTTYVLEWRHRSTIPLDLTATLLDANNNVMAVASKNFTVRSREGVTCVRPFSSASPSLVRLGPVTHRSCLQISLVTLPPETRTVLFSVMVPTQTLLCEQNSGNLNDCAGFSQIGRGWLTLFDALPLINSHVASVIGDEKISNNNNGNKMNKIITNRSVMINGRSTTITTTAPKPPPQQPMLEEVTTVEIQASPKLASVVGYILGGFALSPSSKAPAVFFARDDKFIGGKLVADRFSEIACKMYRDDPFLSLRTEMEFARTTIVAPMMIMYESFYRQAVLLLEEYGGCDLASAVTVENVVVDDEEGCDKIEEANDANREQNQRNEGEALDRNVGKDLNDDNQNDLSVPPPPPPITRKASYAATVSFIEPLSPTSNANNAAIAKQQQNLDYKLLQSCFDRMNHSFVGRRNLHRLFVAGIKNIEAMEAEVRLMATASRVL